MARVGVDRNKQVGTLLIGDGGAGLERDEGVVFAGVDNLRAQTSLQQFAQFAPDFEYQILFFQAVRPDGSGIVAAMAGIDHDLADLQAESANQRAVAAGGWARFANVGIGGIVVFGVEPRRRLPARTAACHAGAEFLVRFLVRKQFGIRVTAFWGVRGGNA